MLPPTPGAIYNAGTVQWARTAEEPVAYPTADALLPWGTGVPAAGQALAFPPVLPLPPELPLGLATLAPQQQHQQKAADAFAWPTQEPSEGAPLLAVCS